ncbi:MAG: CPBP family intramembrane metalloprotease [Clostridiales bacterium]|nr:CPBP family intramembrane metalloprotease [Clostridiales bacterium]
MKKTKTKSIIKNIINIIVGFVVFLLATNFSSVAYRLCNDWVINARLMTFVVQTASVVICLYLYTKYILKVSFKDIYIRKPGLKKCWCVISLTISIAIVVFYVVFIPGKFARSALSPKETVGLLISSILLYGIMTGITEEMIFRGLIMRSVEGIAGWKIAVVISSVLFAFNHLEIVDASDWRNTLTVMGSITVAGLALALITYQTGSIWCAVFVHAVYNILSGGSSLIHISTEQDFPAIFTYTVREGSRLTTGIPGADNVDTALPAVIGFSVMICIALWKIIHHGRQNDIETIN